MKHRTLSLMTAVTSLAAIILLLPPLARAGEIVYPPDADVTNVRDFGAVGDGKTDDTAALHRAMENQGQNKLLYIPDGTYLVSDTIMAADKDGKFLRFVSVQGQSRDKTIIKLKDHSPNFQDPKNPQPVLKTAVGNMSFVQRYANFTIDTGSGNPGATGMFYISCNHGSLTDVTIRSGDGSGVMGLDLTGENAGLSLVRNIAIDGFDYAFRLGGLYPGMAMEHAVFRNQKVMGFTALNNLMVIRDLDFKGNVPLMRNDNAGTITLLDSHIVGDGCAEPAVNNEGMLLIRNTLFEGYPSVLRQNDTKNLASGQVDEYCSSEAVSLFPSTDKTLNLPIEDPPEIPWDAQDNFANWVSVAAFGAKPNDKDDDTAGIQAAFDAAAAAGKSTVYFPRGEYIISRSLELSGSVRRLTGFPSTLVSSDRKKSWPQPPAFANNTEPLMLRIKSGQPAVIIDRLSIEGVVDHAAANTAIFRLGSGVHYRNSITGGKAFFQDYGASYDLTGPQQVWVRLWDPTWGLSKFPWFRDPEDPGYARNDGAQFVVFGVDHESKHNRHVMLRNLDGAKSELFNVLSWDNLEISRLVDNRDAAYDITGLVCHGKNYLEESRDGWSRTGDVSRTMLIGGGIPTDATPPSAPASLTATATESQWPFIVNLAWEAVTDADSGMTGYEIRRNGEHLGWSEAPTFTDEAMLDDTMLNYEIVAINGGGRRSPVISASVTTGKDTTPLAVTAINATLDPPRVHVIFSKPVNPTDAIDLDHYRITGATLTSAKLEADLRTVTLAVDSPAKQLTVAIKGVRDLAKQPHSLAVTSRTVKARGAGDGLQLELFANSELKGKALTRWMPDIDCDWHASAPSPSLPADGFSARFAGALLAPFSESTQFIVNSADGVRLTVDGQVIFDPWEESANFGDGYGERNGYRFAKPILLQAGKLYPFTLEFREHKGNARVVLLWRSASLPEETVPVARFFLTGPKPGPLSERVTKNGLNATYFNTPYKVTKTASRIDKTLDFDYDKKPVPGMEEIARGNWYKIEWNGWVRPPESGAYTIGVDLGQRNSSEVFMDGRKVLVYQPYWGKDVQSKTGKQIYLEASQFVPLYVYYRQEDGNAHFTLWWITPSGKREVIPASAYYCK